MVQRQAAAALDVGELELTTLLIELRPRAVEVVAFAARLCNPA